MVCRDESMPAQLPKSLELVLLAAALASAFFIYRGALDGFFVQDDYGWLCDTRFQNLAECSKSFFRFNPSRNYRPLSQETFFWLGQAAFGMQPFGFHCASMFFFLAGGALVYVLLRGFLPVAPSLAGTLFFTAHGAHFRSVYWISAIPEPMALFFFVGAVILFIRFDRRNARWAYALSVLSMALGICSKESILTLPIVLAAYCALLSRRRWPWTLPFFALSGLCAVLRITSYAAGVSPYPLTFGKEAWGNLLTYLAWAAGLTQPLLRTRPSAAMHLSYLVAAAIFAVVVTVLLTVAHKRRVAIFGCVWFLIALQPVLYFRQHIDPYYLAPSLAGLALALGASIPPLSRPYRWKTAVCTLAIIGYSLFMSNASVSREGPWWNERADLGQQILNQMPGIDRQFPAGHFAYLFGFSEWEFGVMQNDAAFKAYNHSPHTRFILVGLNSDAPLQIRQLQQNGRLGDFFCFVFEKGKLVNRTAEFRQDPSPFLAMTGMDVQLDIAGAADAAPAAPSSRQPAQSVQEVAGYQHRPEVRLEVKPLEVIAGQTVMTIRTVNFDVPAIDVNYSIDGKVMPLLRGWRLDKRHTSSVFVSSQTPKGRYHFMAVRDSRERSSTKWIRVDVEVVVR